MPEKVKVTDEESGPSSELLATEEGGQQKEVFTDPPDTPYLPNTEGYDHVAAARLTLLELSKMLNAALSGVSQIASIDDENGHLRQARDHLVISLRYIAAQYAIKLP